MATLTFAHDNLAALDRAMAALSVTLPGSAETHDLMLTNRQIRILISVVSRSEGNTIRGMAARLGLSKPAVTRSVDRLSELGLVLRQDDPDDRRSIDVVSTPAGIAAMKRVSKAMKV